MKLTRPYIAAAALVVALAGAAVAGVVIANAGSNTTTVKVAEREFKITLTGKPAAGVDRFVIRNTGKYAHALSISGPGVKAKRTALIKPGKSATLVVKLSTGTYALWCPVPGHAAQGMKTSFKVGAAATGGGMTTTSGTTTSGGGTAWG